MEEGNSLATQERICREYAHKNGYEVAEVFIEKGESAKTADRTELRKMRFYCADKKNAIQALIINRVDRLSRNVYDYGSIKISLQKTGVEIKSTSENLEDTPTGRFLENILANVAQLDNENRADKCSNGMKDAVRDGRYVWKAPLGYRNVRVNGKATIAPDEMASLVKESFEMISRGINSPDETRTTMIGRGLLLNGIKPPCKAYFHQMLHNPIYAGIMNQFGEKNKGTFEPIISEELFYKVHQVLKNKGKKSYKYKKDNNDFPLRRFVFNSEGKKLTGSWSAGRSAKYAFYRFASSGKSYGKDEFEDKFKNYIDERGITPKILKILKEEAKRELDVATASGKKDFSKIERRIKELEGQQSALIEKNLKGVISDDLLKRQLDSIDKEMMDNKAAMASKEDDESNIDVEGLFSFAEEYLHRPSTAWIKAKTDVERRIKLQWFQFPDGITFDGKEFGTAEMNSIFKAKEALGASSSARVDRSGFEPLTSTLQMWRSTN